jgi:hypothetical protein
VRVGDWVLQRKGPTPPPAPDGRMLAYATTLYPSTAVPSEATAIDLSPGEQRAGVDMVMRLSPAASVSGVLMGPSGPLANMSVRLRASGGGDGRDASPTGEFTTITSESGAFALLGVPQGQYVLSSTYVMYPNANDHVAAASMWARQPLSVGDRDVTGLTLSMRPAIRISGRVEYRGGSPPEGRRQVMLWPLNASMWRTVPAVVGADGTFESIGDEPGRYVLVWSDRTGSVMSISIGGRVLTDQSVLLESSDVTGLVFTISSTPLHVTGTVVDANGAPATHANVFVFPADTTTWRQGILSSRRRCITSVTTTGTFDCSGLSTGEYYVAAIDAQEVVHEALMSKDDPAFLDQLVAGASRVTLTENTTAQVRVKLSSVKEP